MFGKRQSYMSVSVLCTSVFVCVSVFFAAAVTAQIPQKINYQLRITDLAGEPLGGPHTVTYRIFDAPTDGTQLWEETQNETANDNGVVSTILGTVNPINIPFDGPCWLEVVVDGETLEPRRELVSTPYAFHATNADNLGGSSPSAYSLDGHEHDAAYVNEGQANAITTGMIQDGQVGQADVSGGYVDLQSSQMISGNKAFNGDVDGHRFWAEDAGPTNAIVGINSHGLYPALYAQNFFTGSTDYTIGLWARVGSSSHYGLGTNGRAKIQGGVFASVESTRGEILMTSPLVREMEVYLSGSGHLTNGQARIVLDASIADVVAKSAPMRVIVTPAGMCNGIAVTERGGEGFTVMELAGGTSNVAFDWFVIARKAASPGSRSAAAMPAGALDGLLSEVGEERSDEE